MNTIHELINRHFQVRIFEESYVDCSRSNLYPRIESAGYYTRIKTMVCLTTCEI